MDFDEESSISPDEETSIVNKQPKLERRARSLTVLTTKFVRLLQEAGGGEVDLRRAATILAVEHKRRVYDITNVLEGIGLICKTSKNNIKWIGTDQGKSASAIKTELEALNYMESVLDQQKLWVEENIRTTTEDGRHLSYVTDEDICSCFSGHTILAVRAPPGTEVDVPIPKAVSNCPAKYQIYLKSPREPIDVLLLSKHSVASDPVVLPVPPPKELLQRAELSTSASDEKENSSEICQDSAKGTNNTKCKWFSEEDAWPFNESSFTSNRKDEPAFCNLSKGLQDQRNPPKGATNTDLISQLMSTKGFSPLVQVSTSHSKA